MRRARRTKGAAWLLAGALLAAAPASGLAETALGGSGADELTQAVAAQGGVFAVGKTSSSDGDLSIRTRTGETGWAVLVGEEGRVLWSFCSAHAGLQTMASPAAFSDGTLSCVLMDGTGLRGEWLLLDEKGKQKARIVVPADELCPDGGEIAAMLPLEDAQGYALAVFFSHPGRETMCCAFLREDGETVAGVPFAGQAEGINAAGAGAAVHLDAAHGRLTMTAVLPGREARAAELSAAQGASFLCAQDVLLSGDGSVVICGQAQTADGAYAGFVLRLNAEGETLFAHLFESCDGFAHIAATETGYAVYAASWADGAQDLPQSAVLFLDEDGAYLGVADAPANALDMAAGATGAAGVTVLTALEERAKKQAVLTGVYPPDSQYLYAGALYAESGVRVVAGKAEKQGVVLAIEDKDGQTVSRRVDMLGNAQDVSGEDMPEAGVLRLGGGAVRYGGGENGPSGLGGTDVVCTDTAGNELWRTRTPIHTAADSLEWNCAVQLDGGDLLLAGRYLTGEGSGAKQQGVLALLSGDGVLREIRVLSGVGAVCAMTPMANDVGLLVSTGIHAGDAADAVLTGALSDESRIMPLPYEIGQEGALLAYDGTLGLIAAGTAQEHGVSAALVMRVEVAGT